MRVSYCKANFRVKGSTYLNLDVAYMLHHALTTGEIKLLTRAFKLYFVIACLSSRQNKKSSVSCCLTVKVRLSTLKVKLSFLNIFYSL